MRIQINSPLSYIQLGKRANQEDSRYPDADVASADERLFVVCDGVGGQDAGEVASALVCMEFEKYLRNCSKEKLTDSKIRDIANSVAKTFEAEATGDRREMGTTLAMLCLHENGAMAVHAGDSRIYHIRGNKILYRSEDHSLVNSLLRNRVITESQAENHPQKNVITNCFYRKNISNGKISVDVKNITDLKSGDYFFLCSDGVTNAINDSQLVEVISDKQLSDRGKIRQLAEMSAESSDNNTAILVSVSDVSIKKGFFSRLFG